MDLKDMIVTADAMNCQKDTVAAIASRKGDYVTALKRNQQLFYEEVQEYFEESVLKELKKVEEFERGHWGVEVNLHWHLDFTFQDDKNKSMGKTSAKNLQIMKKIALGILNLVKESYKISMKRTRYELSLDYENEIEKMLSMLDIESVKKSIVPKGKVCHKISHFFKIF